MDEVLIYWQAFHIGHKPIQLLGDHNLCCNRLVTLLAILEWINGFWSLSWISLYGGVPFKTRAIQTKPHSITHWTVWSDLGWGFWTPWFYSSLLLHACFVWRLFNNLCTLTASLIPLCSAPSSPSPACLQQLCSSGNQSLRKFYFPLHARIVRSPFLEVSLTDMVSSHCYSQWTY